MGGVDGVDAVLAGSAPRAVGPMTERAARRLLTLCAEGGDARLGARVAAVGAVAAAAEIVRGASPLAHAADLATRLPSGLPDPSFCGDLEDVVEALTPGGADRDMRFVIPGDAEWPSQLHDLGPRAPLGLWVSGAGSLRLLALRSVSIVGSRAATSYGEAVARAFSADLAEHGWCVVSGGAFGIDAAAHRGALSAGGSTVCVLAGGVDVAYPRSHASLLDAIRSEGLLVSEAPPGSAAMRHRFLTRNRVIAALTRGTVVVEAAQRSGSRTTAREASELGRLVMAVPGPVTSVMSGGCHDLVREGVAVLIATPDHVRELVGPLEVDPADGLEAASPGGPGGQADLLSPREARVLDAVPLRRAAELSSLSRVAGIAPADVLAALGILEASGLIRRSAEGWQRRRA